MQSTSDANCTYIAGKYIRTNASYCIIFTDPQAYQTSKQVGLVEGISISVAAWPPDYQPCQKHDLSALYEPTSGWVREYRYVDDFADYILGDPEDGRHFEYELIYSDPPAKPAAK